MGYIYCITNTINNKKFVGKTLMSIEKRFSEHIKDSKRRKMEKRPLYNAMNKYGADKFTIEILEEVNSESELSDREIYWIEKLGTYGRTGYNATKGGDGKQYYDHEEIARLIELGYTNKQIITKLGCCIDIIRSVSSTYGLIVRRSTANLIGKFDSNGVLLDVFYGSIHAAKKLYEELNPSFTEHAVECQIRRCCVGKIKSAYGFVWKYLPEPE